MDLRPDGWERIPLDDGSEVWRLRVPGGWLYLVGDHPPVFVPER